MREGKAGHLKIREGRVVRAGALGWVQALRNSGIRGRLLFVLSTLAISGFAVSGNSAWLSALIVSSVIAVAAAAFMGHWLRARSCRSGIDR